MRPLVVAAACLSLLAPAIAVPTFAVAQSARDYGSGDLCREQKREAATKGTIIGGILGAILGSQVSGHGARTEGSVVGGVAGAVAGNQIGRHSVRCSEYPRGITYHRDNCRWVEEYYDGRYHGFEVCRDRDGVWRPSGRG